MKAIASSQYNHRYIPLSFESKGLAREADRNLPILHRQLTREQHKYNSKQHAIWQAKKGVHHSRMTYRLDVTTLLIAYSIGAIARRAE